MRNVGFHTCSDLYLENGLDIYCDELDSYDELEIVGEPEVSAKFTTKEVMGLSFLMDFVDVRKYTGSILSVLVFLNLIAPAYSDSYITDDQTNSVICALLAIEQKFANSTANNPSIFNALNLTPADLLIRERIVDIVSTVDQSNWRKELTNLSEYWLSKLGYISVLYHNDISSMLENGSVDTAYCPSLYDYLKYITDVVMIKSTTSKPGLSPTTTITTINPYLSSTITASTHLSSAITTSTNLSSAITTHSTVTTVDDSRFLGASNTLFLLTYIFLAFFLGLLFLFFFKSNNEKIVNFRKLLGGKIGTALGFRGLADDSCTRYYRNDVDKFVESGVEGEVGDECSEIDSNISGLLFNEYNQEGGELSLKGSRDILVQAQVHVVEEEGLLLGASNGIDVSKEEDPECYSSHPVYGSHQEYAKSGYVIPRMYLVDEKIVEELTTYGIDTRVEYSTIIDYIELTCRERDG